MASYFLIKISWDYVAIRKQAITSTLTGTESFSLRSLGYTHIRAFLNEKLLTVMIKMCLKIISLKKQFAFPIRKCNYHFSMSSRHISIEQKIQTKSVNTLRPRQKRGHFADDIFKRIFLNENVRIWIKISLLKFLPGGPIDNIPALVQIMAWLSWLRLSDKPLSEPVMVTLPTDIFVTRPQWVNENKLLWTTKDFKVIILIYAILSIPYMVLFSRLRTHYTNQR